MTDATQNLQQFAEALRRVRTAYEQYFSGLERLEPLKERDAAKKMLQNLLDDKQRNTAQKFRLQTLQATWLTWETYWNRIARQIEDGTFKRDKQKALYKQQGKPGASAAKAVGSSEPAGSATFGKPEATGSTDFALQQLLACFAAARKSLGLDGEGISLASLTATVNKQTAAIKSQYQCQTVDFKVAIKDGKPILKATPR